MTLNFPDAIRRAVYLPSRYDDDKKAFVGGEWVVYGELGPVKPGRRVKREIIGRGATAKAAAAAAVANAGEKVRAT